MSTDPDEPDVGPNTAGADALCERPDLLAGEERPSPPQQERSRRAHDGLLAAALVLFAEHGYEATAIDEIARRAGVAVGGFYLHFRSKRQVLLVLMDRLLLEVDTRLGAQDDANPSPERLLTRLHFDTPYAGVYRAWREAALRDPALAAFDAEIEAWTSARIAAALRVAVKPGARSDVDLHWFAWMLSVVWWRLLDNLRLDRDALTKTAAALVNFILSEDPAAASELRPATADDAP